MDDKSPRFQTNKHTMWIGNVRNLSFQDQLQATTAAGLNELSMTPLDFDRNLAKGLTARDMRIIAADVGVVFQYSIQSQLAPQWRTGIPDPAWMEFLATQQTSSFAPQSNWRSQP